MSLAQTEMGMIVKKFINKTHPCRSRQKVFHDTFLQDRRGYVYILSTWDGIYKIGRTTNLERRIKSFVKTPNLKLIYSRWCRDSYSTEKEIHHIYYQYRVDGEWFRLTDAQTNDIRDYIDLSDLLNHDLVIQETRMMASKGKGR